MLKRQWGRIAKTVTLALVVGSIAAGMSGIASATVDAPHTAPQNVVAPLDIETMVAWPFETCDRQTYPRHMWGSYYWFYDYDHTDNGFVNFYRVYDSKNNTIGNGWASCSE